MLLLVARQTKRPLISRVEVFLKSHPGRPFNDHRKKNKLCKNSRKGITNSIFLQKGKIPLYKNKKNVPSPYVENPHSLIFRNRISLFAA